MSGQKMSAMIRDHYDWVVLGDHPAALWSACITARAGYSVLIAPIFPSLKAQYSSTGQWIDFEPNFVLGLGTAEVGDGLVRLSLGTIADEEFLVEAGALPQIVTPDVRVGLTSGREAFRAELSRELGEKTLDEMGLDRASDEALARTHRFWREYPRRLMDIAIRKKVYPPFQQRFTEEQWKEFLARDARSLPAPIRKWFASDQTIEGLMSRHPERLPLAEICAGLYYALTGLEREKAPLLDLNHLLALGRLGGVFPGGLTEYRRYLIRTAARFGAHVADGAECRRIFVENGRWIGMQLARRPKMIGVEAGVVACSLSHVRDLMTYSGRTAKRRKLKAAPRPKGWRFTVSVEVHPEAIPPGFGRRAIWKEWGAPSLEIELAPPGTLLIRTWLPFSQETLDAEYQRKIASRMLAQVSEIFPFLEYHVVRVFPDFRGGSAAEELSAFSELYGFVAPEMIPENLRMTEAEGVGCFSGIEGLYVASGESYPSLGGFGGTIAALESMSHFIHSREKAEQVSATLWSLDGQ